MKLTGEPIPQGRAESAEVDEEADLEGDDNLRGAAADSAQDGPCDCLRRNLGRDPRHPQVGNHRRIHPSGEDGGDGDAVGAQFLPQDVPQTGDGELRRHVGAVRRDALFAVGGGDEDDMAASPGDHVGEDGLNGVEDAVEVHRHRPLHVGDGHG
jgi:hypothetical protein